MSVFLVDTANVWPGGGDSGCSVGEAMTSLLCWPRREEEMMEALGAGTLAKQECAKTR